VQLAALVLPGLLVVVPSPAHARHAVALAAGWYDPRAQLVHAVWLSPTANVPGAQGSHAPDGAMMCEPGGHGQRAKSRGSVGVLAASTVAVCSVTGSPRRQTPAVDPGRSDSSRARSSSVKEMPPSARYRVRRKYPCSVRPGLKDQTGAYLRCSWPSYSSGIGTW